MIDLTDGRVTYCDALSFWEDIVRTFQIRWRLLVLIAILLSPSLSHAQTKEPEKPVQPPAEVPKPTEPPPVIPTPQPTVTSRPTTFRLRSTTPARTGSTRPSFSEGQALQNEVGDSRGLVTADTLLGLMAGYQGRYAEAVVLLDGSRWRGEELWGGEAANFIANYQGRMAYYQGDVAAAQAL